MNCQQFFHANISFGVGLEIELHSGWARRFMVFEHCWLTFEGEIVDLTIDPSRTPEYLASYSVSYEELVGHMAKGFYGCTDVERLWETMWTSPPTWQSMHARPAVKWRSGGVSSTSLVPSSSEK